MSPPVLYLVAQHGEDQAMAFLGDCGQFGILEAMQEWDERNCGDQAHGEYEWTDWPCLDVYVVYDRITEDEAINECLVDLGARLVGSICPIEPREETPDTTSTAEAGKEAA